MFPEDNKPVDSSYTIGKPSIPGESELNSEDSKGIESVPPTVRGQLAELIHAVRSRDDSSRDFLLRVVQPGLAGLMDGSVSTLAPIFATAFVTHNSTATFLVGMASATGAGISMAFSEGLSDDGSLTGRGSPWLRGTVTGLMTTAGGIGHTLPFLIQSFRVAMLVAIIIVAVELGVISYVRHRYMDTPFLQAAFQVIVGGVLVFVTGWLIGSA